MAGGRAGIVCQNTKVRNRSFNDHSGSKYPGRRARTNERAIRKKRQESWRLTADRTKAMGCVKKNRKIMMWETCFF